MRKVRDLMGGLFRRSCLLCTSFCEPISCAPDISRRTHNISSNHPPLTLTVIQDHNEHKR